MSFCHLLNFFNINFFEKKLSGIPSECQTGWIQIKYDVSLGLIWVQSVCKGYEHTTLGGNELKQQRLFNGRQFVIYFNPYTSSVLDSD